jgi:hypothetical protein
MAMAVDGPGALGTGNSAVLDAGATGESAAAAGAGAEATAGGAQETVRELLPPQYHAVARAILIAFLDSPIERLPQYLKMDDAARALAAEARLSRPGFYAWLAKPALPGEADCRRYIDTLRHVLAQRGSARLLACMQRRLGCVAGVLKQTTLAALKPDWTADDSAAVAGEDCLSLLFQVSRERLPLDLESAGKAASGLRTSSCLEWLIRGRAEADCP